MGKSDWSYFTPFHDDPEVALQELRELIFQRGDFVNPPQESLNYFLALAPIEQNAYLVTMRNFRQKFGLPSNSSYDSIASRISSLQEQMRSIDGLFREFADEGTHSILDIIHVAYEWILHEEFQYRYAYPLPAQLVEQYISSATPSHEQVEMAIERIFEGDWHYGPWVAIYFTVYSEGQPTELFFAGSTGD